MIKNIIFDWGEVLTVGRYTKSILKTISKEKKIIIDAIYPEFDRLIVEMNAGNIDFNIPVDGLPDGIYFVIMQMNGETRINELIVRK